MKKSLSLLGALFAFCFCSQLDAAQEVRSVKELKQTVANTTKPVYVEVYSKRCPHCRVVEPVFEKVSEQKAKKGTFLKLSLDKNPEARNAYQIRGVPTLLIFDSHGKLQNKISGSGRITDYLKKI